MNQMAERLTIKINLEWTCSTLWSLLMSCNINIWLHPDMAKKLSRYRKCSLTQNWAKQIWIFFLVTCWASPDAHFCQSDLLNWAWVWDRKIWVLTGIKPMTYWTLVFRRSWAWFLPGTQSFFFVQCLCYVDQFTFHISLLSLKYTIFIALS